jgi:uncharacterized damage-inducible protein DinB
MKTSRRGFTETFLAEARHSLGKHHLPRIVSCLDMLSDAQIWWRPNEASNSIGNMVLHLSGNVRQWIIAGLGGEPDRRERDKEFSEHGPIARAALVEKLEKTVSQACRIISRLTPRELARPMTIQKFHVTGFVAVNHVTEHFAFHAGQILYVTKLLKGEDLGFTRLPGEKRKKPAGKRLPAI